jgi:hypothetical protein
MLTTAPIPQLSCSKDGSYKVFNSFLLFSDKKRPQMQKQNVPASATSLPTCSYKNKEVVDKPFKDRKIYLRLLCRLIELLYEFQKNVSTRKFLLKSNKALSISFVMYSPHANACLTSSLRKLAAFILLSKLCHALR